MRCGFCATENGRNSIICNAHNVSGNKPDVGIAIFPGGSPGKSRILNRDRPRYRGENTGGGGGGGEKNPILNVLQRSSDGNLGPKGLSSANSRKT